jgi:hypothetical protein
MEKKKVARIIAARSLPSDYAQDVAAVLKLNDDIVIRDQLDLLEADAYRFDPNNNRYDANRDRYPAVAV